MKKKIILLTLLGVATLSLFSCSKGELNPHKTINRVELISYNSSVLVKTSDTTIFMTSYYNPKVQITGSNLSLTNIGFSEAEVLLNNKIIKLKAATKNGKRD